MNDTDKTIRRAQSIHPYGPGAILDWGQECFAVLDTGRGGWKYAERIELERLSRRLGATEGFRQAAVVSEYSKKNVALRVQRFPTWLFCPSCRRMYRWGRQEELDNKQRAPRCRSEQCRKPVLVPMRYVAVCDRGHLTEPDWVRWAHANRRPGTERCSARDSLEFIARNDRGSTLQALEVRCRKCGSGQDLGRILEKGVLGKLGQRCPGRQPWQSQDRAVDCGRPLTTLQRSQTAVHFGEIVSALDLQLVDTESDDVMRALVEAMMPNASLFDSAEALIAALGAPIKHKIEADLGRVVSDEQIQEAARRVMGDEASTGDGEGQSGALDEQLLLEEEWPALTKPTREPSRRSPLIVSREAWPPEGDAQLHRFIHSVHLIERLREVRAFRGFRRQDPGSTLVHPNLGDRPPRWLPAIEVFGEGIMIELSNARVREWEGDHAEALERRVAELRTRIEQGTDLANRFKTHSGHLPRFIVAHTFAHVLMRQLCYECGYGSASLRERLYVFDERCGVLIYTAEGDSEGSLGGLVRQGRRDRIGATIRAALRRAEWCSNDPICREMPAHGLSGLVRAACHACGFAPETSCTQLNALLDRDLLIGGESGLRGFMRELLEDEEPVPS
jgi:hypothetical protein